jgi:hypothetical protein
MLLTWHLRHNLDSPVGEFLQLRLSHTRRITIQANKQVRCIGIHLPSTPYCPFKTLEWAIRYRIGYSFALTPQNELLAWRGAFERLVWTGDEGFVGGPYTLNELKSFFECLDATLNTLQPVGHSLDAESERILAHYCFVLALFEEVYRSKGYRYSPLVLPRPKKSVDELLAIAQEEWIDDLCNLFTLFHRQYAYMLPLPHILNPPFLGEADIGSASADLIVDGCLIEIKASIEPVIRSLWLRHLAGCALLDYEDQHHIHSVGIYMARQGRLVRWSLDEFLGRLTGEPTINIASLRQEFRACCKDVLLSLYW